MDDHLSIEVEETEDARIVRVSFAPQVALELHVDE
jgi:hypothetical protein